MVVLMQVWGSKRLSSFSSLCPSLCEEQQHSLEALGRDAKIALVLSCPGGDPIPLGSVPGAKQVRNL